MLGDAEAAATIPTKDMASANKFYKDTLGLKLEQETKGGNLYKSGSSHVFVYETQFAGTNKATTAGWTVKDVDAVASDLKGKGVALEHYDSIPGVTLQGDVHVMGDLKAIWFKDPDGNILSVTNQMG